MALSAPFAVASATSFLASIIFFKALVHHFPEGRQRSWIITFTTSLVMSFAAFPFVLDFILARGNALRIGHRPTYSSLLCGAFQGALISDLVVGTRHYPQFLTPTLGWGHHITYALLVPYIDYRGWAHFFGLCLIMELPTCLMAISFLWPRLRNDYICAAVYFVLRICFHAGLLVSAVLLREKDKTVNGLLPSVLLFVAFLLHMVWFKSLVAGIRRRRTGRVSAVDSNIPNSCRTPSTTKLSFLAL